MKTRPDLSARLNQALAQDSAAERSRLLQEAALAGDPTIQRVDYQLRLEADRANHVAAIRAGQPGARFCESPAFGDLREGRVIKPTTLLSSDELAARLRLNDVTDSTPFQPEVFPPDAYLAPGRVGRVSSLVRVVPADSGRIHVARETSRTRAAAATDFGTSLPQATIAFGSDFPTWSRIGSWVSVDGNVLDDKGIAAQVIDEFVQDDVLSGLDAEILVGDGTGTGEGTRFTGLLNDGTLTTVARGADTRWLSIVRAAATIRGNDFLTPITALVSAADAVSLFTDVDDAGHSEYSQTVADALGLTVRIVSAAPSGTAVVGALSSAVSLYLRGGLVIDQSNTHGTSFTDGTVAVRGSVRGALRITRSSGVRLISGFGG